MSAHLLLLSTDAFELYLTGKVFATSCHLFLYVMKHIAVAHNSTQAVMRLFTSGVVAAVSC